MTDEDESDRDESDRDESDQDESDQDESGRWVGVSRYRALVIEDDPDAADFARIALQR